MECGEQQRTEPADRSHQGTIATIRPARLDHTHPLNPRAPMARDPGLVTRQDMRLRF